MDFQTIQNVLGDISSNGYIIPLIIGLFFYRKADDPIRLLIFYLGVVGLTEIVAQKFTHLYYNNAPVYHFFTVIQFAFFCLIYQSALKNRLSLVQTWGIIGIFALCAWLCAYYGQNIWSFNSYITAVESLLLMLLPLWYFYQVIQDLEIKYLEKTPMIWVSIGTLVYFASCFFIFLTYNYFVATGKIEATNSLWTLHSFFNILFYFFLSIGIWSSRWNTT